MGTITKLAGAATLLLMLGTPAARAHDGTLDSYGCHINLGHKIYHCHRGPLAGQQFDSREHMLHMLKEKEMEQRRKTKPKIEARAY